MAPSITTIAGANALLTELSTRTESLSKIIVSTGELRELRRAIEDEASRAAAVAQEAQGLAARRHDAASRNAALRREVVALKEQLLAKRGWKPQSQRCTNPPRAPVQGADKAARAVGEAFLRSAPEAADMNQYWYSPTTIETIVTELEAAAAAQGGDSPLRVAFLSTPSVFFSLPESSAVRAGSIVFDYDRQWEGHANYRFFNFDDPAGTIQSALHHSFDFCVVDPPFITRDVWTKYAEAIRLCLKPADAGDTPGRVILTTVGENEAMLRTVLGEKLGKSLRKTTFMPAMQKPWYGFGLPYQYSLYVNFELRAESRLNLWNHEVPEEFSDANATRMPDEAIGAIVEAASGVSEGSERAIGGSGLSFEEILEREMAKEAEAVATTATNRTSRGAS